MSLTTIQVCPLGERHQAGSSASEDGYEGPSASEPPRTHSLRHARRRTLEVDVVFVFVVIVVVSVFGGGNGRSNLELADYSNVLLANGLATRKSVCTWFHGLQNCLSLIIAIRLVNL